MTRTAMEIPADFGALLGESRAITDRTVCGALAVDGVCPLAAVYPGSAQEVAAVLRSAADRNLAVIAQRNATKLDIGAPPRKYDVALSLKDLNRVWYYEPDDLVVSVEPGMKFGDLQHFLARHKLWVPLDPPGGDRASVGGILAANAAGPLRLRYGGPRDMVLGMKIAMPDGQIVNTGGRVVKNVAGYDLGKLLIGSYGTLGVIVEATFKLFPQVANRATWMIDPGTLAGAREIRREVLASPLTPLRMVLLNARTRHFLGDAPTDAATGDGSGKQFAMWIEAGGSDRVIARYATDLESIAARHGASPRPVNVESASEVWGRVADLGTLMRQEHEDSIVVRAALPITSAEDFLETAEREAEAAGFNSAGVVQMGVGMIELAVWPQSPGSKAKGRPVVERLREITIDLGGHLVVTRCPVEFKSQVDLWGAPEDDFEIMRKLKATCDPKGTLSPRRFLGAI